MFKLEFKTDNAVFVEFLEGEINEILSDVGESVIQGNTDGLIHDHNGNTIGKWSLT